MDYLEKGFLNWEDSLFCSHCRKREYDFFDEDDEPICYRCYNRLLRRKEKREKLTEMRIKERIKRKEARQFYEILKGSDLLKEYQIGFVILDYLVV